MIEPFHVRYMAANKIVKRWVEAVRLLNPSVIAPQHGAVYTDDKVELFLDWLSHLQCGIDYLDRLF